MLVVFALAVALGLVGGTWLLFRIQHMVVFPGSGGAAPPGELARFGGTPVWLEHEGGRSEAWWLPSPIAASVRAPAIVFAHGNGELIDHWVGQWELARRAGLSVLLVEFPGYGRSQGVPSERSVGAAMRAAYDWIAQRPDVDTSRIVAYGRSLGGGAACGLVRERPVAALVLESTFTSVRDLAWRFAVPAFLVRDVFDNEAALRAFRGPILLLHGMRDEVIPPAHAAALQRAAPAAELHWLACGHNDCERPWPLVESFLARSGVLPPGGRTGNVPPGGRPGGVPPPASGAGARSAAAPAAS